MSFDSGGYPSSIRDDPGDRDWRDGCAWEDDREAALEARERDLERYGPYTERVRPAVRPAEPVRRFPKLTLWDWAVLFLIGAATFAWIAFLLMVAVAVMA